MLEVCGDRIRRPLARTVSVCAIWVLGDPYLSSKAAFSPWVDHSLFPDLSFYVLSVPWPTLLIDSSSGILSRQYRTWVLVEYGKNPLPDQEELQRLLSPKKEKVNEPEIGTGETKWNGAPSPASHQPHTRCGESSSSGHYQGTGRWGAFWKNLVLLHLLEDEVVLTDLLHLEEVVAVPSFLLLPWLRQSVSLWAGAATVGFST